MKNEQLCWSCENCTSTEKCPFVKNINDFYEKQKRANQLTYRVYVDELDSFVKYKTIPQKQLAQMYIKGTEINSKGYITKCPNFKHDGLIHNVAEYYQKAIGKNGKCYDCFDVFKQKYYLITNHLERTQNQSEEQREKKREEANLYIKNILLNRKIEQLSNQKLITSQKRIELLNLKNIDDKQIALQQIINSFAQPKEIQKPINDTSERITIVKLKKIDNPQVNNTSELITIIKPKKIENPQKLSFELGEITKKFYPFDNLSDEQMIDFIKQVDACYVKNSLNEPLTQEQIEFFLKDNKRLIEKNKEIFLFLNDIFKCFDLDKRKHIEDYCVNLHFKTLEEHNKRSKIAKLNALKRKNKINKNC